MKKLKLFLAAAMLIGIGSAFTTVEPKSENIAYGFSGGVWREVDRDLEGTQFLCNSGSTYCLYEEQNFDHPIGTDDKQFVPLVP